MTAKRRTRAKERRLAAGLILYRLRSGTAEVLLAHPGGPYWRRRDAGAWSIPKGEVDGDEDLHAAALREFHEETGLVCDRECIPLGRVRGHKTLHAWAFEGDCDPSRTRSNTFLLEWPRGSGDVRRYPEVDRTAFFPLRQAYDRISRAQVPFLDRLAHALGLREP